MGVVSIGVVAMGVINAAIVGMGLVAVGVNTMGVNHRRPMSMGLIQIRSTTNPRYLAYPSREAAEQKPKTRLRGRALHGRQLLDALQRAPAVTPAQQGCQSWHCGQPPDVETGFDQLKSKAVSGFRASG